MAELKWDKVGERYFETGVDHGVLYLPDANGDYGDGVAWNGLVSVTESPSGAEASPQYADNIKYLNLISAEEFGGTIEAFQSPVEFDQCDGTATPYPGLTVAQQSRKSFGLSYRNLVGNDTQGTDFGEKIHLVYGAQAAPSEKTRGTVNDSPEAVTFSWEFTTTPVEVPGLKPSAHIIADSRTVDPDAFTALKTILYGTAGQDPRLPLPAEVFGLFEGTVTVVVPTKPTQTGNNITIPTVAGVIYKIDGEVVTGTVAITEDVIVEAQPAPGYTFPPATDADWGFEFA
ncbi:major tail protein [Microbacterium phage DizzyRudy]|nr:major tail protein [Microbacterium phage DizzyRudy]